MFHTRHEFTNGVHVFPFQGRQTHPAICGVVARHDLTNTRPNLDMITRYLYSFHVRVTGPDTNKSGPQGPMEMIRND